MAGTTALNSQELAYYCLLGTNQQGFIITHTKCL